MDFQPSADQLALQQGIRAFCADRIPPDALAGLADRGGFEPVLWRGLAELGVFSLRRPEPEGGLGLGLSEAVLVFEELGRHLVPGPLLWSELAAGWIEGAATGEAVVGALDLVAAPGEPWLVEHLDALDVLLVVRDDGAYRVDPRQLDAEPVAKSLDALTPVHHVRGLPEGERVADAGAVACARLEGAALTSALSLGIAEATLELAVAYAKQREQFERVIGSFQAIKHILADMFARQELARAAVYAAGATLDHPEVGDPEQAVRGARLIASEAAMKNARACIQVHGGMGYTWEVPAHHFFKRCWVLDNGFGSREADADWLGARVGAEVGTAREAGHGI